jgi:hypothetical protein
MPKSQDNFDKNFDEINNLLTQVESYIRLAFDNGDIKIIEKAENDLNKAKHLSDVYGVKLIKNKNRNGVEQYKKIGLMLNTLAEKKSTLFNKNEGKPIQSSKSSEKKSWFDRLLESIFGTK